MLSAVQQENRVARRMEYAIEVGEHIHAELEAEARRAARVQNTTMGHHFSGIPVVDRDHAKSLLRSWLKAFPAMRQYLVNYDESTQEEGPQPQDPTMVG